MKADSTHLQVIDGIHYLFPLSNPAWLESLSSHILNIASSDSNCSLETLHDYISKDEINNVRLKIFHSLNQDKFDWASILETLAGSFLHTRLGPDYLIQSKVNLSIQMPFDETSVLPVHSDCVSGDSPWQLNFWLPLTKALRSSSMFLISRDDTLEYLRLLVESKKTKLPHAYVNALERISAYDKHFVNIEPGSALLFHPGVLHGNVLNTESFTRVSLNIRLKSIFAPDAPNSNPDRQFGTYYKVGRFSLASSFSQQLGHLFSNYAE
jgi:sporadic carbohydrate cluster 2OG-Fe(II) oxygenase